MKYVLPFLVHVLGLSIAASFAGGPPKIPQGSSSEPKENKQITLDDLFTDNTFRSKSVKGLRSMNDGLHYTTLESADGQSVIVKSKYETGEVADALLHSFSLITKESVDTLSLSD